MKQFRLSKKDVGVTITTFHVYNSNGDTIGHVNVPNEDAADLAKHWLGSAAQPQASVATKPRDNAVVKSKENALAEALKATRPAGAIPPVRASKPNPAVEAMLTAAKKNRLSQSAILRGC